MITQSNNRNKSNKNENENSHFVLNRDNRNIVKTVVIVIELFSEAPRLFTRTLVTGLAERSLLRNISLLGVTLGSGAFIDLLSSKHSKPSAQS